MREFCVFAILIACFTYSSAVYSYTKEQVLNDFQCKNSNEPECYFLKRSLNRDSKKCYQPLSKVKNFAPFVFPEYKNENKKITVSGWINYRGVFPGKYKYQVYKDKNGNINLYTNVHLSNVYEDSDIFKTLRTSAKNAAAKWTKDNPFKTKVNFIFDITTDYFKGFISATLLNTETRGPYFWFWSKNWDEQMMHEFAHILGLDDEYESLENYPKDSMMGIPPSYPKSKIYPYHYYLIFRRILCH